ncbi:MAG: thiamine pyrophosphate-dependent enzyme [Chloroflexi bacterium]|nr:thiamine pyrophosphate-dependent enzyme [Chloroflexota bacterium]MDA1147068.1 thiamine pyrophosphate-dependent enzyme [Chloroflexota bacterium]
MTTSTTSGARISVDSAIEALARRRDDQVVVSTMTVMRPWRTRAETDRDLVCVGFMGGASTFGLGVQLARPDVPVWVLDGDGSLAMQLGSLLTIANAAPRRFLHVVLHNGVYDTSGAQPVLAEGRMSFADMAKSAGYADAVRFDDIESFELALDDLLETDGPVLVELITEPTGDSYQNPEPGTSPDLPADGRPIASALASVWPKVRDSLANGPAA